MSKQARRSSSVGEHAAATAWTIWLMWPFIRLDRYVVGFDTLAYTGPNFAVGRRQWTAGHIPFWDSGIFGGIPHLANPQTAELYPLKFLGYFFSTNRALGLLAALHMVILANGLVVLVSRRLGLRAPAGLVAAVAFTGSGMGMTKSIQLEQILVLAWLPWLCVCIHGLFFGNQPRRWTIGLALCAAFSLLAGHPQVVYIEVPLLAVSAIVAAWISGRWRRFGWLVAAGALGTMLAAPQLLLMFQATGRSPVSEIARTSSVNATGLAVNPARFVQTMLGDERSADPVAASGGFETVSYLGVATTVLALLGLSIGWRRRRLPTLLLAATAVGAVLLSFGRLTIVHRAAVRLIPGYSLARVPARWMIVPTFLAAIAAGFAIDALRGARLPLRALRLVGLVALLLAVLSAKGSVQAPGRIAVTLWVAVAAAVIAASWVRPRFIACLLLLLMVGAELGRYNSHSFARQLLQPAPVTDLIGVIPNYLAVHPGRSLAVTNDAAPLLYLVNGLRPNANNLAGARSIDGYDGGVQITSRWLDAMSAAEHGDMNPSLPLRAQIGGPLDLDALGRLGMHYFVVERERADASILTQGMNGPVLSDGTLQIWENPKWIGEATMTDATGSARAVTVVSRRDGEVTVSTTGTAGLLRVDEQFAPEWHVTIDGRAASVQAVERFSVGVNVPAGDHKVIFTYAPSLFWVGSAIAALALLLLVGLLVFRRATVDGPRQKDFGREAA